MPPWCLLKITQLKSIQLQSHQEHQGWLLLGPLREQLYSLLNKLVVLL